MRIIRVYSCYDCPFSESDWNRKNQDYDMRCSKLARNLGSGKDSKTLTEIPCPQDCPLEEE